MKKTLLILISFVISIQLNAQIAYNTFNIRNYNRSLAVAINQNQTVKVISDEFGKVISIRNLANADLKYLHHGQEYDSELGLYFYPSRIYSTLSRRFLQTDPMSQYATPYSFLGGDPINKIDETGNADKPLFLHYTNREMPDGKEYSLLDMQSQVGDAYYVPLSDFLNGEVPDMPEFNGTVFIESHMSNEAEGIIETERGKTMSEFKTPRKFRTINKVSGEDKYLVTIKAPDLGSELRDFADIRQLDIKNIIAGGCQGRRSAMKMGAGFAKKSKGLAKTRKLRTAGVKDNHLPIPIGEKTAKVGGYQGLSDEFRWHVAKGGVPYDMEKVSGFDQNKFTRLIEYPNGLKNEGTSMPYANGAEFKDMAVDGRIPKSIESTFSKFDFAY